MELGLSVFSLAVIAQRGQAARHPGAGSAILITPPFLCEITVFCL